MKISVLVEDLLLQENSADSEKCAIARALKREFPDSEISVCLESITIGEVKYLTSTSIYNWQLRNIYEKPEEKDLVLDFNYHLRYVSMNEDITPNGL